MNEQTTRTVNAVMDVMDELHGARAVVRALMIANDGSGASQISEQDLHDALGVVDFMLSTACDEVTDIADMLSYPESPEK